MNGAQLQQFPIFLQTNGNAQLDKVPNFYNNCQWNNEEHKLSELNQKHDCQQENLANVNKDFQDNVEMNDNLIGATRSDNYSRIQFSPPRIHAMDFDPKITPLELNWMDNNLEILRYRYLKISKALCDYFYKCYNIKDEDIKKIFVFY